MKYFQGGFSENASYKIVALLITLILWVIILGSKEAAVVKSVHTEFILPHDVVITSPVPDEVNFRLTGPRLPLKRFSETTDPLVIDLSSAIEGSTTIRIHPDSIDVPAGIHVINVSPATITAKLEKLLPARVPIEATLKGSLPKGKKLGRITVDPPYYEFTAPRSMVEKINKIVTEPIDLNSMQASWTQNVGLILEGAYLKKGPLSKVKVSLEVKQE